MKRWAWLGLVAVVAVAIVALVVQDHSDPSPQARAERLSHELACPECSGESVADSNSVSARAIREQIPKLIDEGKSDGEIRAIYVQAYGERVLLTPADNGIGLVAWIVPVAVILAALAGIVLALRRWSRTPRLAATAEDEAIVATAREHDE